FCAHAPGAVEPLGSAIKYFRSEFEAGIAPASATTLVPGNSPTVVGA
ncbi:NADH dehydrogenase I subunit F, partial [Pseudomonas savastanoi pv. glycinea str. race 4]